MAEERVSDIVIPIVYELHDEGYKKTQSQLNELASAKGVKKIQSKFSELSKTFMSTRSNFTLTEKSIVDQVNKASKSLNEAAKAWENYAKKRDAVTAYKRNMRKNPKKYTKTGLNKLLSEKDISLNNALDKTGIYRADYSNLLTKQDQYQVKQEEEWAKKRQQIAEEWTKAAEKSERDVAEAAKKSAQEQEEAKERVRKAWQSVGNVLKKPVENFRKSVRTLASTLYVMRRFVSFFKSMANEVNNLIQASSSWIENLNLLEVVFGDVSENAEKTKKWVAELSERFSMDRNSIVQYVSTFKQMANAMGQAADTGERMSEVLVQLGLDISSLRNVKTETAMSDLASAIAGQIKPVRKYGFDVTQQSINALLQESGIGGTVTTLSQADKQLARTILLVRQSRDAWGDLGKTINTFANQQRIMQDQFETTKRLLGQVFIGTFQFGDTLDKASKTAGIATKAMWQINGVLIAFNEVLEAILPNANSVNGGIATLAEDATEDIEDMNEALNSSLASFDKFNVMTSGGTNAFGNNATLQGLFDKETAKYIEDFKTRSKQIASYAREISNELLGKLFPEYKDFHDKYMADNNGDDVGAFAAWAKSSTTAQDALSKLTEPITKIKKTLEEAFEKIDIIEVLNAIAQITLAIVKVIIILGNALVKVSNALGTDGIVGLLKTIVITLLAIKGIKIISGAISGINKIAKTLGTTLALAMDKIITKLFKDAPEGLFNVGAATEEQMAQMSKSISGVLSSVMGLVAGFATLGVGIATYLSFSNQMSSTSKKVVIAISAIVGALVAVITAIATITSGANIGIGIMKGLAAGAAATGIALSIGSTIAAMAHAQGGYQTGGLFYAGENGAEWVGRQGNTSTIVNDKQMSDIMQQSVAMGVIQGNRMSGGGRTTGDNKPIVVNVDGKRLFEVVEQNGKKVGKVFVGA